MIDTRANVFVIIVTIVIVMLTVPFLNNHIQPLYAQNEIEWKKYTSNNLGFSIDYPADAHIQTEQKTSKFSPEQKLKIGSNDDNFIFSSTNLGSFPGIPMLDVVNYYKQLFLDTKFSPNSFNTLVVDSTSILTESKDLGFNLGFTYVISEIDDSTNEAMNVANTTYLGGPNRQIYSFNFVAEPEEYDEVMPIFSHMLNSIVWLN